MSLDCFSVPVTFRDGVQGAVAGFCPPGLRTQAEARFRLLERADFGPAQLGADIDGRLTALLRQAAGPLLALLPLTGASVRRTATDGPCGGVLGALSAPDQSLPLRPPHIPLHTGQQCRLLLRPGRGAVAFFCTCPHQQSRVAQMLERTFPAPAALELLYQQAQGFLWITDYAPDDRLLDGRCLVHLSHR